jgi:hypothetical protein
MSDTTTRSSREREAVRERIKTDFMFWALMFVKIQTRRGQLVPLKLNRMQRTLELSRRSPWVAHLKGRQMGATTYHAFRALWRVLTRPDWHALIIAHEEKLPRRLLRALKLSYELMPDWIKPQLGQCSGYEMTFPKIRSSMSIATAGVQMKLSGAQLGQNFQSVVMTECADPRFQDDIYNALVPVVPYPEGELSLDSTPKGKRGFFFRTFNQALGGASRFEAHFSPWFLDDEEYQSASPLVGDLTQEEQSLIDGLGVTLPQISWRREMIETVGPDSFRELYPENTRDCWLHSGTPAFDPDAIEYYARQCQGVAGFGAALQRDPSFRSEVVSADDLQAA